MAVVKHPALSRLPPRPLSELLRGPPARSLAPVVPRKLHVVWVGPHVMPERCIASWRDAHPEWEFTLWRDHTGIGWANEKAIHRFAAYKVWNGVADIMRYEILFKHGGVVVDADSRCLREMDDELRHYSAWAAYESELARPGMIACGAMGAAPGGLFFRTCSMACATADPLKSAWSEVGPGLLTHAARKIAGLHVFPARLFTPTHYTGVKAEGREEPIAEQMWQSTRGMHRVCDCAECRVKRLDEEAGSRGY